MHSESYYNTALLRERSFFTVDEEKIAEEMLGNAIEEYPTLNAKVKESGFAAMYRIKKGNHRLFGIKTKKNNVYWIALIEPKGNEHKAIQGYWPKLEPLVKKFVEYLENNPEPVHDRTIAKKENVLVKTIKPVEKSELVIDNATPLQLVRHWVDKIQSATDYETQYQSICELAKQIEKCGHIFYENKQYKYQVKEGGSKYPLGMKLSEPVRIMEGMHRDIQEGQVELMKLFSVMCLSDQQYEQYIKIYSKKYIQYFESHLKGAKIQKFIEAINENWGKLRSSTQIAFLKQASNANELYEHILTEDKAKAILAKESLVKTILKDSPCPWDIYTKLVTYFEEKHIHVHMEYLNKFYKKLRKDTLAQQRIKLLFQPYGMMFSKNVQKILGFSNALVPVNLSKYGKAGYRRKNYLGFKLPDWIRCFESGLGKEEFMGYVDSIHRPNEASFKWPILTQAKYCEGRERLGLGLVFSILKQTFTGNELNKGAFQQLISYWYHLDLLSEKQVREGLCLWFSLTFFEESIAINNSDYILKLIPDIGTMTFNGTCISVMLQWCNWQSGMVATTRPRTPGRNQERDERERIKKLTRRVIQYLPMNENEVANSKSFLGKNEHVTVQYSHSYIHAMHVARFDLALEMIKKRSIDEIQNASVSMFGVKICDLNIRELLLVLPTVLVMSVKPGMLPVIHQTFVDLNIYEDLRDVLYYKEISPELNVDYDQVLFVVRKGKTKSFREIVEILKRNEARRFTTRIPEMLNESEAECFITKMKKPIDYLKVLGDETQTGVINSETIGFVSHTIQSQFIPTIEAYIDKTRDNESQRDALDKHLSKMGMKISQKKLDLLEKTIQDTESPFLQLFTEKDFEPQCLANVSERLAESEDISVRVPTAYIEKTNFSDNKKGILIGLKLISVLELAVLSGFKNVVYMLINEYKVPFTIREKGITALHIAIWRGDTDMALELLAYDHDLKSFREDSDMLSNWVKEHVDQIKDLEVLKDRLLELSKRCKQKNTNILGDSFKEMLRIVLQRTISLSRGESLEP